MTKLMWMCFLVLIPVASHSSEELCYKVKRAETYGGIYGNSAKIVQEESGGRRHMALTAGNEEMISEIQKLWDGKSNRVCLVGQVDEFECRGVKKYFLRSFRFTKVEQGPGGAGGPPSPAKRQ